MNFLVAELNPLEHVVPHTLINFAKNVHVSNQMFMATVAAVLLGWLLPRIFSKSDSNPPTGVKNLLESILEFLRIEVFKPALKENTDRFVPFLWTLFLFILTCNLLGFIPFAEVFYLLSFRRIEGLGGTATGTTSTTAGLAIFTFFFIHGSGIATVYKQLRDGTYGHHDHGDGHGHDEPQLTMRAEGAGEAAGDIGAILDPTKHYADADGYKSKTADADHHDDHSHDAQDHGHGMSEMDAAIRAFPMYLWNFAPHPFRPPAGSPWTKWIADIPIWGLLLVLELVGALIKPFSLAIRLFANMVGGHIVLAVLAGLIAAMPTILGQVGVAIPITLLSLLIRMLELFVCFLQAYIFCFLSTLFIASAVAPEH